MRKRGLALVGPFLVAILALCASPAFAEPRILSKYTSDSNYYYNPRSSGSYSSGGNYYYSPRLNGGPTGYSGANAPIRRASQPKARQGTRVAKVYAAPCGNFNRVKPRHCPPTKAWDSSFNSPYSLSN